MNGYRFPQRPYPQTNNSSNSGGNIMDLSGEALDFSGLGGEGQSLDQIVSANDMNEKDRRRSMPVYPANSNGALGMSSPDSRRLSMMQFGDGSSMDDFQFSMQQGASLDGMMRSNTFPRGSNGLQSERSAAPDLAINTQFANGTSPFPSMGAGAGSAYASPLHQNSLDVDMMSPYPDMSLMDINNTMMSFPNPSQFSQSMLDSPVPQDFPAHISTQQQDRSVSMPSQNQYRSNSSNTTQDALSRGTPQHSNQSHNSSRSTSHAQGDGSVRSGRDPGQMAHTSLKRQEPIALNTGQDLALPSEEQLQFPWTDPPGGFPSTMNSNPHMKTQFKNAYSSTGFDMLSVLMRVATRPDPQIDIGSVDLSCAFVVCDAEMDDIPIVYCSENFERLTGYSKHMILGRNCRFLQSPDGKVEPGIRRKYVDDDSVLYLKNTIEDKQEAQISLINYRRGGQPFMNLLTMIPIAWETGGPVKFIVGFQVDLVEQPGSMTNKNPDGSYRVNYQRGMSMPSYVYSDHKPQPEAQQGQTISKDEVSNVLASYGSNGETEISRRMWDKVLLENNDDVVHVLSLKGLFLYLSPSSNKVLEYDPSELVGTALSSVCHPSDIVPVTRELKETSNGASVNVVFRIRRKRSGYMWFEGHGSLHTEQGKGRKCIILVGRERPVYTLSKTIVRASGGIGDNELWTKLSTSGMFLFVSSNVRSLLDKQPDDLIGTSIQTLMRQESKQHFGRILELARSGRKGEVKHELINKRGQVLQAFTTIYPGDATEGHKPTFLVGQSRLLKYTRNSAAHRPAIYTTQERFSNDTQASLASVSSANSTVPGVSQSGTPGMQSKSSATADGRFFTTEHSAATFAGSNGLTIGHQDLSLASDENVFDELKTTRSTSWQFELRQMEKRNRYLAEEVQSLLAARKKRKRRKGAGQLQKDCANCHTRTTPEWRRGPSGNRDLCNSCGLRWAKQQGRVSPRTSSAQSASDKSRKSASPRHSQSILPNIMPESSQKTSPTSPDMTNNTASGASKSDPHGAKVPRTDTGMQGFNVGNANIPPKIEEGIEPD